MNSRHPIRFGTARTPALFCALAAVMVASLPGTARSQTPSASLPQPAPSPTSSPVVLDRVVAVVNNHVILASDLDEDIRLSVLEPGRAGQGILTPQRALQQLIGRALIEQQISQEDAGAAPPSQGEVNARLTEMRKELPVCVHRNCASNTGWKAFLAAHGLTQQQVDAYLRTRLEILGFIEQRFRPGIRISSQQIATYYHDTLLPQYPNGQAVPPLKQVAPRIEEVLLERQVNVLFGNWLANLRKQGHVEVLDPALEPPQAQDAAPAKGKSQ